MNIFNKFILPILAILLSLFLLIVVLDPGKEKNKMDNSIPVKITNNTNCDLCIVIYPVIFGDCDKPFPKKQFITKSNKSELLFYYTKELLEKNYCIIIEAWSINGVIDFTDFDKLPYFTKSFYNPNYTPGPEEYRFFAELIIE